MQVILNGKTYPIDHGINLKQFLLKLNFNLDKIAVECDKNIISRNSWESFILFDGAKIEVLELVAGG